MVDLSQGKRMKILAKQGETLCFLRNKCFFSNTLGKQPEYCKMCHDVKVSISLEKTINSYK